MSLDSFLPPYVKKPQTKPEQEKIIVQETCSNPKCKKPIGINEPVYNLNVKGVVKPYCRECARAKIEAKSKKKPKPKEDEENE
jgi:hypothetical protein